MLKKDFSFGTSIATVKVHLEIRQFLEFIMNHEVSNTALKTINTVMMWLFCLTVLMLIVPWQAVSTEFADRIESNKIFLYFALIIEISNFISQAVFTVTTLLRRKNSWKGCWDFRLCWTRSITRVCITEKVSFNLTCNRTYR